MHTQKMKTYFTKSIRGYKDKQPNVILLASAHLVIVIGNKVNIVIVYIIRDAED